MAALLVGYALPTQLVQEDIEYLIQASAFDVFTLPATTGYDDYTGHGRIDAGAAIAMMDKEHCSIAHYGTDTNFDTKSHELLEENISLYLSDPFTNEEGMNFNDGTYTADVYKVTATVTHPIPPGYSPTDYWERHSASTVLKLYETNAVTGSKFLLPVEFASFVGTPGTSTATLEGYVYYLKNFDCSIEGWIPTTPANADLAYTLIACDATVSSHEQVASALLVYPNPVLNNISVVLPENITASNVVIEVFDVAGRKMFSQTENTFQNTNLLSLNVEKLPQGIFSMVLRANNGVFSAKFIKIKILNSKAKRGTGAPLRFYILANMKCFIYSILLTLVLTACCDDDSHPIPACAVGLNNFSENFPLTDDTTFKFCQACTLFIDCEEVYSSAIPFDYYYPCFNPNNPEQLAYARDETTTFKPGYELWVRDFCTGEQKMIAENLFYGLDWSVKDWLIYTTTDQNIWKIKSNGDSLTQLTFAGDFNRYPRWSPDGERILLQRQTGNTLSILLIVEENGQIVDTITQLTSIGQWSWIDETRICYWKTVSNTTPTLIQFNYYNTETKEIKPLHTLTVGNTNDSLVQYTAPLLSENSVLWFSIGMIGKTNLETGEFQIIRKRGRQEWFQEQMTVRPGGRQILYNNRLMHNVDPCTIDSEFGFFLIDVDGNNSKKIIIPE